jgi:hypothetical protein
MDKSKVILDTVRDLVGDFLYYDRKEDEQLPRGAIQQAVRDGDISEDTIIAEFATHLRKGLRDG